MAVIAFLIAMAAIVGALIAIRKTRRANAEVVRLARSLDIALRDLRTASERNNRSIHALGEAIDRSGDSPVPDSRAEAGDPEPVAPEPASRTASLAETLRRSSSRAEPEATVAEWMPGGRVEITLQPIIDVIASRAVGFDVFLRVLLADGSEADIRRVSAVPDDEIVALERMFVWTAIEAGRLQLAEATQATPLQVAVSAAFVRDTVAMAELRDLISAQPTLSKPILLAVPTDAILAEGAERDGIALLAEMGIGIVADGAPGSESELARLRSAGAKFLKLPASRILDRSGSRRRSMSGQAIVAASLGAALPIIAVDVSRDEDAVALLDLGCTLMAGRRFQEPRKLRSPDPQKAAESPTDAPSDG